MFLLEPKCSIDEYRAKCDRFEEIAAALASSGSGLSPADRHFAWKEYTEDEDFHEWPVPAGRFFSDPYYIGTDVVLWPLVKEALEDFFNPAQLFEVLLMIAGLGSGKSHSGSLGLIYRLYELGCMKHPQKWLSKFPHVNVSGDAEIVLMNASAAGAAQASKVVYSGAFEKIMAAPFFQLNFEPYARKASELLFPHRIRLSPGTSKWESALGWNLYFFVVDEAAFGVDSERADYVRELFLAFNQRRRSRWGRLGGGMLLTSPGSEYAYVEVIAGNAAEWEFATKVWRACTWEAKGELVPGAHVFLVDRDPDSVRVLERDLVFLGYDVEGNGLARRQDGSLVKWRTKLEDESAEDLAAAA